uniref:NADH-ubiquinone oxidoreductase chain 2 n=1 Tax=Funneliformis mosseae TaxID=27381 RepID=A0A1D6YD83_FUNMO|nr:NADH dehydrogenase subunit 2 [Funneliformis mosseae]
MLLLSILLFSAVVPLTSVHMSTHVFNRLAILVLLYSSVLAWNMLYLEPIGVGLGIYGGLSHVTLLSQAFDTFILACASIILLLGSGVIPVLGQHGSWFEPIAKGRVAEYPLIILFTTLGMSSLVSSSDLVTLFLSIELQSLALYILATIYRDSEAATSAGLKYFIVGALSSSLILLGSCLLYGLTGVSSFEGVYLLCSMAVANSGIHLALVIIGIALLFKVAAAPFHNWAPDVYDGVPTIVTTWLAIMPKVAILAFLGEFQGFTHLGGVYETAYPIWPNILLVSALLSLVIGGLLGLAQYRIKRLLAYSTISHMGFILLALAIHTQEGIEAYLFYLVQYVLTSINIFFVLLAFGDHPYGSAWDTPSSAGFSLFDNAELPKNSPIRYISHISRNSNIQSNPALALTFAITLFSMAGTPPLLGFFAKLMVLYAAGHAGFFFLVGVAIMASVISAAYYLRVIRVIFFDTPQFTDTPTCRVRPNGNHSMVIGTITLLIILFIANPLPILNCLHLLALSLFYW